MSTDPLQGITEADFGAWKHHPVTKLFLQFLRDYELIYADELNRRVRLSMASPDQFALGKLAGYANAILDVGNPTYESIAKLYELPQQETEEKHAA